MDRKECFGFIKEVRLENGMTHIQTKAECRDCQEFRDCLRESKKALEEKKERDELKKQNIIALILDLSHVLSNEIGSCLLEFLNRIYSSPLGTILLKNLPLFFEIPRDLFCLSFTLPISPSSLDLILERDFKEEPPVDQTIPFQQKPPGEGLFIRIVLIQRSFPNNRKANMGLIAYELARLFSSDSQGIHQIIQTLTDSEISLFKKMDAERRIDWLLNKWGFRGELEAFKKEWAASK